MADRTVLYKLEMTGNLVPKSKELSTHLKVVEKNARSAKEETSNLRKVMAGIGSEMGSTGGRVLNLAEGLGGAGLAGAATVAVAGFAALMGALVRGVHSFAEYAKVAADAEVRIRGLGLVTEQQAAKVRDLGVAYKQSQEHLDAFKVKLASLADDEMKKTLETSNKIKTVWEAIKFVAMGALATFVEHNSLLGFLPGGGSSSLVTGPIKMTSGVKGSSDVTEHDQFPVRREETIKKAKGDTAEDVESRIRLANAEMGLIITERFQEVQTERIAAANEAIGNLIVDKLTEIMEDRSNQAPRVGGSQGVMDAMSLASGGVGGMAAALGGPVGMIASAVVQLGPQLGNVLKDGITQVFDLVTGLPGWINEAIFTVINSLETMLPKIIEGIVTMAPKLVIVLIRALPHILIGITKALLAIPGQIVQSIKELPMELWEAIKSALGGLFKSKDGDILGTDLRGGDKRIFGIKLPKLDTGGTLESDGVYFGHKGERVLNPAEVRRGGGGNTYHFHGGVIDTQGLIELLRKTQGAYGRRNTLDPLLN